MVAYFHCGKGTNEGEDPYPLQDTDDGKAVHAESYPLNEQMIAGIPEA